MGNNICCIDPPHRKYKDMSDIDLEFEKKDVKNNKKWDIVYAIGYGASIVIPTIVVVSGGPLTLLIGVGISTLGLVFYIFSYCNDNIKLIAINSEFKKRSDSNIMKIKKPEIIEIN